MRIAIFATHPIQYHVPWYRELSCRPGMDVRVYFACIPGAEEQGAGFDIAFKWDIPMLEGYRWEVLESKKSNPGLQGFFSCRVQGMRQVLRRDQPDVVLLTGWQALPLLQALLWCVLLRIPRIVRGESNGMKPRRLRVRFVHRLLLPLYNGFLAIGRANRQFYTGYGVGENKIFSCPYFVENERLLAQVESVQTDRQLLRSQWGIASGAVCFLYVGKLVAKKRIQDQLEALQRALLENSGLHLLVVGTGELMEAAVRIQKEKQLPVTFAGFLNQTEITQAYAAADCLILSSDYDETWGLVVNEAMVCGLPGIVSDRCGSGPDLIEEGITGTIYPFGNISALAEAMLEMAKHPGTMRKMGKKAQQRIIHHYNVEKTVNGTLKAVEYVAGQAA